MKGSINQLGAWLAKGAPYRIVKVFGIPSSPDGIWHHWEGEELHLHIDAPSTSNWQPLWLRLYSLFYPGFDATAKDITVEKYKWGKLVETIQGWPNVIYDGWPEEVKQYVELTKWNDDDRPKPPPLSAL